MEYHEASYDELLVVEVQKRRLLYDYKCGDYKNYKMRSKSWYEISEYLNTTVEKCQGRWKSIRDRYRRETIRPLRKFDPPKDNKKKLWYLAPLLSFLDDFIQIDDGTCNEESSSRSQPRQQGQAYTGRYRPIAKKECNSFVTAVYKEMPPNSVFTAIPVPITKKENSGITTMCKEVPQSSVFTATQIAQKSSQVPDSVSKEVSSTHTIYNEEDYFGLYIAGSLRKLSQKNRSKIKFEIQKLIYEAEQEELLNELQFAQGS